MLALKPQKPDDETAEEIAIEILTWLAAEHKLMERFLAMSGIDADDMRNMIGRRSFYAGLIAFVVNHEPTLLGFCAAKKIQIEWVMLCYEHFSDESVPWE